ncbi:SCO family protein [Streptomyces sp. TP-A0874]|uniref:SCO family protein n=1 Tax=Streptomyces sp. TP-A0874 TaxID=549819 RepID=UPI00085373E1|nr:SCO family protein [Streptomyces sp. TP-A0874]
MRTTPGHPPARRARLVRLAAALVAAAGLTLTACGSGGTDDAGGTAADPAAQDGSSTVLDQPFEKPDLVLKDTSGKEYDLIERTKGRTVLLYFGYTHCPDVCPLTMSNIAIARKQLSPAEREKLDVVFVTSDPARDTPEQLGEWLRGQDPSFTGLTGDFEAIEEGARSVGIYLDKPKKEKDGTWVSSHGTQVLAFSAEDDKAHVLYNKDATAEEYAEDLPEIISGGTP